MFLSLLKKIPTLFAFGLVVAGLMTGLGWFMQNHRLGSGKAAGVEPPAKQTPSFHESFDHAMTGPPSAAWSRWSNSKDVYFEITAEKSLSEPNSLACTGRSSTVTRAWLNQSQPADVQVSATVFLNTLIPAQVLIRGSRLDAGKPTYYAVAVNRGLEVQLLKVLDGQTSSLGKIKSADYFSGKWARVTISAKGKTLRAQICRPDTKQFLNGTGEWQDSPARALEVTDSEIVAGGLVGLGRPASYAGTLFFDDFQIGPPSEEEAIAPISKLPEREPKRRVTKPPLPTFPPLISRDRSSRDTIPTSALPCWLTPATR
jgi:hypothetical protein